MRTEFDLLRLFKFNRQRPSSAPIGELSDPARSALWELAFICDPVWFRDKSNSSAIISERHNDKDEGQVEMMFVVNKNGRAHRGQLHVRYVDANFDVPSHPREIKIITGNGHGSSLRLELCDQGRKIVGVYFKGPKDEEERSMSDISLIDQELASWRNVRLKGQEK